MRVAVAVAVAATLGVAACGSPKSSDNGGGKSSIGGNQVFATDPNAPAPAPAVPGAKTGGTITIYAQSTPNTFDPTDIYYTDSNEIGKLMFRTMTQFIIRKGQPVLVPDLTDLGTQSADGLTWTFKMKTGQKYEDGTEIKVEDLAYAIERMMDNDAFQNGPKYQFSYFDIGDYKGPYLSPNAHCKCVETQGADTLIIHLKSKFSDLPFYATFPAFSPIPKAKDNKADYKNHPISSGPYAIDSYTPGTELKLKKNPNWDPNTDPARHQYADAWDFKWGQDDIATQQQILNGTGVGATALNYVDVDATLVDQAKAKPGQLIQGDSPCTIVANMDTRKIKDINVRKAIATAYPLDDLWKAAGLNDMIAEPASTILPPAVPGYADYKIPFFTGTGNGDPVKAKQMLTDANALGFEVSWFYSNESPIAQQVSDIRSKALIKAGFKTRPIGVPTAQLRTKISDYTQDVNFAQGPRGWCSDWPSGGSWFPVMFRSQSIDEGTSWGFLQDPALDQKINDISNLPPDQQTAKWTELDKYIMETYAPVIPIYYTKTALVAGSGLGGLEIDGTVGMPNVLNMYVK
jgi:peptide/nickel transport system substrate-binding protein